MLRADFEEYISRFNREDGTAFDDYLHAKRDAQTVFGIVQAGDQFDYRGLIMYDIRHGKFATITVAYNAFTKTSLDGSRQELGIAH